MAAPYIPSQNAALATWSANFAAGITAAPGDFGLDAPAAATIQAAVDAYGAAYALAGLTSPPHPTPVNPGARTPTTIADMNTQKLAMIPIIRTYAAQIRLNPGVSNMNKLLIGLNLPNNSPSPIPEPATMPVITIIKAQPLRHVLKFRDELASPTSRAKAPLTIGLQLYRGIDSVTVNNPDLADFYGVFTKVPFNSDFDSGDVGKLCTYFGRWTTRAGSAGNNQALVGPWGVAVSMTIVGTG